MAAVSKNIYALLMAVAALCACSSGKSEDMKAYLNYNTCTRANCFAELSPHQKTAVFFGAMEIHPPDVSIEQELAKADLAYLKALKSEIERRGGSYEAYSFVAAVLLKHRNGELTDRQVSELNLLSFCRDRGDLYNLCSTLVR